MKTLFDLDLFNDERRYVSKDPVRPFENTPINLDVEPLLIDEDFSKIESLVDKSEPEDPDASKEV